LVRLSLGLLDSAAQVSEQVRIELLSHGHATTIASATFCTRTWPELVLDDLEGLERDSAELAAYCAEKKVSRFACWPASTRPTPAPRANLSRETSQPFALRSARYADQVEMPEAPSSYAILPKRCWRREIRRAEAALQDAFAFVEQSGEQYWLAGLTPPERTRCAQTATAGSVAREACFRKAIEIARGQEARLLELRTAIDLARLWRDTRSDNDPRALLEPILAAIEGGETTHDVRMLAPCWPS